MRESLEIKDFFDK